MKLTSSHFANSPEPIPVMDCCLFSVVLPDLHPLTSLTLVAQLTGAIPLPLLPAQSKIAHRRGGGKEGASLGSCIPEDRFS